MQKLISDNLRVLLEPILDDCAPVFWPLKLGVLKHTRPECLHLGDDLPFTHTINGQTFVAGVAVETGLQQLFSGTPLFRLDKTGSCGAIVQPIWADNPDHLELLQKGRLFLSVAAAEVFYLNLIEAAEL